MCSFRRYCLYSPSSLQRWSSTFPVGRYRNRLTVSPELIRRVARLRGVGEHDVINVTDLIELFITCQLGKQSSTSPRSSMWRLTVPVTSSPGSPQDAPSSGSTSTIPSPSETVVLFRMRPPRLWGYAVPHRLPCNAGHALPSRVVDEPR